MRNRRDKRDNDSHNNRKYLTDAQFQRALKTFDTGGKWISDRQWPKVLREVWKRGGQVYGHVIQQVDNGYTVDLLGQRAFMYSGDAHPQTDDYIGQQLVFEIKHFETTQWKGRPQTNIIVTNNIYDKS
jgi:hypothetical protein